MDKKEVNTSGGLERLVQLTHEKKAVQLSEKIIDKLAIINFYDDMWQRNLSLEDSEKLTKREIIERASEMFRVSESILYRLWVEGNDKLGLEAVMPKMALFQYVIDKSIKLIDREEAKLEPDNKASAMLLRNLTNIALAMPEQQEEREPLPIPIFVFNPELLANHENIAKIDIPKILAELRAKKEEPTQSKIKGGEYVDFDEK
jgi:hypothetical protein